MPAISNKRRIENLYYEEREKSMESDQTVNVTFRLPLDTANMLTVIGDRFGTSRHALGLDIIKDACQEMFRALSPEDRTALAEKADDLTTKQMLEKGYTCETHGITGSETNRFGQWRMLAVMFNDYSTEDEEASE